jgi:hypothetical protein
LNKLRIIQTDKIENILPNLLGGKYKKYFSNPVRTGLFVDSISDIDSRVPYKTAINIYRIGEKLVGVRHICELCDSKYEDICLVIEFLEIIIFGKDFYKIKWFL